jgi:hypothetical protein
VSTNGGTSFANITNNSNYSGNNSTTLTVSNTTTALSGTLYRAFTFNAGGNATSGVVTLTVNSAPAITLSPLSQSKAVGQTVTFTAGASGGPAPTLQWQFSTDGGTTFSNTTDGGNISGSNTPALTIINLDQVKSGRQYRLFAYNYVGTATSTAATLTISTPPSLTTDAANTTVTAGNTATFFVVATGTPTPSYVWQVSTDGGFSYGNLTNGGNVSGVTTANLTLSNTTAAQNGYLFQCVVSNTGGTILSSVAVLTVNFAPVFTTQPSNAAVTPGANTTFTVATTGNPAPTVQWQVSLNGGANFTNVVDGGNISGSTTPTLSLTPAFAGQNGDIFRCVATNSVNATTSTNATLTVTTPPMITAQPMAPPAVNGFTTFALSVTASGSAPFSYQWMLNGVPITGATGSQYIVLSANASYTGNYTVLVTNAGGNVTSAGALINVEMSPAINIQPKGPAVKNGSPATMFVSAYGVQPLKYQWYKNGRKVVNGGRISGALTSALSIARCSMADVGKYDVVITNALGTVTSTTVTLTIVTTTSTKR